MAEVVGPIPTAEVANGKISSGDFPLPYQPTWCAVTMNVATANPYKPRIDGAAIGWRNTRAWFRHSFNSVARPLPDLRADRCFVPVLTVPPPKGASTLLKTQSVPLLI